ncbi:MAG: hypothetical protein JW795_18000 [Chitinivibrionales bacterium]|nr:hypothetical protein [Chitinivibrionales bacterium]
MMPKQKITLSLKTSTVYLSSASILFFASTVVSGILLLWNYIPMPEKAFLSLQHLRENNFAGPLILSVHCLSSLFFGSTIALTMLLPIFIRSCSAAWLKLWLCASLILILSFWSSITGRIIVGTQSGSHLLHALCQNTATIARADSFQYTEQFSHLFFRTFIIHSIVITAVLGWLVATCTRLIKKEYGGDRKSSFSLASGSFVVLGLLILFAFFIDAGQNIIRMPVKLMDGYPMMLQLLYAMSSRWTIGTLLLLSCAVYVFMVVIGALLRKVLR